MGEAFIWYRGRDSIDPELLKPTTITANGNYTAPITGTYRVYTVGGGGGGGGGCRNAWNVSQVFYGAAGTRGTLNVVNVNLNKGDNVTCTIGAGGTAGTNNTTRTSYTNGTYNSRGTNGTAGGSTSFGSHSSGAGGTYGAWSWSRTYWNNVNTGWVNTNLGWNNTTQWNNQVYTSPRYTVYTYIKVENCRGFVPIANQNFTINAPYVYPFESYYNTPPGGRVLWRNYSSYYSSNMVPIGGSYNLYKSENAQYASNSQWTTLNIATWWYGQSLSGQGDGMLVGNISTKNAISNTLRVISKIQWNNRVVWNNTIQNTTTRCYTSIQTGSWWYLNNNTVTTSGTRIYRGDGGNSGRAGNAGYILIIPPQS